MRTRNTFAVDGKGSYPSLLMAQLYAIKAHENDGCQHVITRSDGLWVSTMYPEA